MKKILFAVIAALTILLGATGVSADSFPELNYNGKAVTMFGNVEYTLVMNTGLEGASDATYTSADPSTVEIINNYVWNMEGVPLCIIKGKKGGSTNILVNVTGSFGSRTVTVPITVIPYQNPLKSFVIGGVDVAPQFSKATVGYYTGIRGMEKVTYSFASGWEGSVIWSDRNYEPHPLANGETINFNDLYNGSRMISIELSQPATGNGMELILLISDVASPVEVIPELPIPATPVPTKIIAVIETSTPAPTKTPSSTTVTPTAQPTATPTPAAKKKAQPMKVSVKTVTVKYKSKKQTIAKSKVFSVTKAQGKVTYKKQSGSAKLSISSAGKITVAKGTKKGTYKMKVVVKAAGNTKYKAGSKTVTVKVKVS